MVTPGISPSKSKGKAPRPFLTSLLIITPCIVLLFFLGIYVGSTLVTKLPAHPVGLSGDGAPTVDHSGVGGPLSAATEGLPGTKNVLAIRKDEGDPATSVELKHSEVGDDSKGKSRTKAERTLQSPVHSMDNTVEAAMKKTVTKTRSHSVHSPTKAGSSAPPVQEVKTNKMGNLRGNVEEPKAGSAASMEKIKPGSPRFPNSFHATGSSVMVVKQPMDSANIVVGAWVHLDEDDLGNDKDMRTVFTNKAAGCENHAEQYGLSLYINAWQEHDHRVHVEYGSSTSGCHKVSSTLTVSLNQWFHVAVAMQTDPDNADRGVTRIYVDGEVVATSTEDVPPHALQKTNSLFVGRYGGGSFPFEGNISHFAVVHPPHPMPLVELDALAAKLMDVSRVDALPGVAAHYSLENASVGPAKSSVGRGSVDGAFQIPQHVGKRVFGLRVPLLDGLEGRQPPTDEEKRRSDELGRARAGKIKDKMKWIWDNYHKYAYGHDELKPISRQGGDPWGNMGVTLVDSLDTLWLMGLKEEFWQARDWVRDKLTFSHAGTVSVFETTIRELGGLLSAYDLSGDPAFLAKARELGDKLSPAFSTSTGVAWGMVDFHSGRGSGGWSGSSAILSEFGTLQIEFRNLAAYTKEQKYEDRAMKGLKFARTVAPTNGLFPIKMDINSGRFTDSTITFGALGDSFYEYLLKVWVQGGKKEAWLREMYDKAMDGVMGELLAVSDPDGLVFVADLQGRGQHRKMDHLVCFLPGLLALGAHTDPTGKDSTRARRDMAVAKALMYTCRQMYHTQVSGIAPEYVEFPPGQGMKVGSTAPFYILRPETAESMFILNQLTGDPVYREWAWEIWEAIEKNCKAPHGYGALRNVMAPSQGIDDRMESFFTAETVKYLWLAQQPDKPVDLDEYVFNTEAHPTKIFAGHTPVSPH